MFKWNLAKGLLVALPVMLGMYAISLSIATSFTQSFAATEARKQVKIAAMSTAARRVLADFKLARENCKKLVAGERLSCNRDALREQRQAASEARVALACTKRAGCRAGSVAAGPMYAIDTAMYNAHRQLPEAGTANLPLSP